MPGVQNGGEGGEGGGGHMVTNGRNGGAGEALPPTAGRRQKSDDSASFLRAARGGNTEKVLEYLKNGTDINTCNANGLNALHLASKEGHKTIVTELLGRGAKIDSATKKGNTALHIASLAGQVEVVKILVTHSASVNVQSQNGFTPLYMAAQENHDEVVRFLLASGASQSLATEDGFTPLAVALQQGHDKVVAVLLENDTRGKVRLPALHIAAKKDDTKAAALLLQNDHNPDVTSKSGFTPLHIAAHYGNESIAVVLLQRGADVNYSAKHNITPLHVAAKWGKGNMVGLLLDKGANLEARTRDGLTPLHCAARSGHENVVDMMLQRGAPISAKTKNGLAPVHMASQGDHVDAARVLLHHKAPVDEVTVDYLTALHVAAHCGHVRVAKLLLDRKADPNSRALNGFTPLHIACKKNRIKVVELLLKYGASKEAKTESGLTPLHVASFMGCMNIVIFLIQHQASPDEATVRGETPLHLAARANQTDIIRILLRNGAKVDARAREQQTPLHIASRLGNVDIVVLLLQSQAQVDAVTKDLYTALHIAAKEGQEEVAAILVEHGAEMSAATKKGFTPLHLSAKYGNMKVAKLLIAKDAPVDAEGKNGVTPLHVAVHYDNQNVAMLLLDKSASPHACAKNGYTPLHISAKKNQLDIAKTLLDYGAKVDAESKAGFSPLHLAGQEGHTEIATLLIKHGAGVNAKAKNGLTPIHLCAQENKVEVAELLVENGANCDSETKAGYTPLHVASHFGQMSMVKFLLEHGVRVDVQNELGYSPLHQAAQQGHSQIVNLLLEANASPNTTSNTGQTALSIAQKLGYISVVETLKVVTDTVVTTTTTTTVEEKYKVLAPESMQETFMSDSEDEGGEGEEPTNDKSYQYLTTDDVLKMGDDHHMDLTNVEGQKTNTNSMSRSHQSHPDSQAATIEDKIRQIEMQRDKPDFGKEYAEEKFDRFSMSDNAPLTGPPISAGKLKWKSFLVSFMVDARGGAMRGCRHSGVRVIIPPRKAPMPMRVTCRYLKKDKLIHPPPLMEGEAIASRILELGPAGAKFLGPVIIEVPHFASLRGKEREIVILRSDNGENWKEHTLEATEEAVQEVLQDSFDEGEATQLEDLNTSRITRILTTDFPQYFAIITRIRQEVHAIGPEGGVVNSTVVPQVQAVFPQGALTKKIKVGLQAQPIPSELTAKLLGNRVAVSPIVTVEPRRRKFHKPITLTIPVPVAASKGMINQYSGDTPTLRLLCSITGGTTRAQWEDVTGSTPLTFVNDCVNFTTTVSARFWLMDCRNVAEATKMATSLYKEAIYVPFMAKFCVFSKRHEMLEARMRVFCMTDDKEEKTLENQEHFCEVAKSRDVEVMEGKTHHLEFYGNLFPVTKSGEQLSHKFHAFRENRLPFTVRVKDPNSDPLGRISFFQEPKRERGEAQQPAICNLNVSLPEDISPEAAHHTDADLLAIQAKYSFLREAGYGKFDTIHRADLRLSDISNLLGSDWIKLARELEIEDQDINLIISEYPDNVGQQAMVMLRLWLNTEGNKATGNALEKALKQCDRQDIVNKCMFNVEQVTDNFEKRRAENEMEDQAGFAAFKEELEPTKNGGAAGVKALLRDYSIHVNVDESEQVRMPDTSFDLQDERLADVTEEVIIRSDNKQEEATSVYEREEQKYVAEEKEFSSSHMSQNLISESRRQETSQVANSVVIASSKQEMMQEEMKRLSVEEKQTMRSEDGRVEVTSESRLEEQHQAREQYNNQIMETRQSQVAETEDGTTLILTEAKTESRQAFSSQSQESKRFEQTETTVTGAETSLDEAANLRTGFGPSTLDHASGGLSAAAAAQFPNTHSLSQKSDSPTLACSLAPTDSQDLQLVGSEDMLIKRKQEELAADSPLTETDTGIESLAVSSGEKMKSRALQSLDLKQPTTDTEQEFSELSPSPEEAASPGSSKSVRLIVIGARKLEKSGMFGKADPYVMVSYGQQTEQSQTVKDNLNPEWNFENIINVNENSSEEITLEVYDKDTVSKDDFMGRASIPTSNLSKLKHGQWFKLQGCKSGDVFVSGEVISEKQGSPATASFSSTSPTSPQKTPLSPTSAKSSPEKQRGKKVSYGEDSLGMINIKLVKAADLKKKSDPYAVVTCGKETFKTKTMKKTQEPEWNHDVTMNVTKTVKEVKIEVYNKKTLGKDELLGYTVISTNQLLQPPHSINSWLKLEGAKDGQIFVSGGFVPSDVPVEEEIGEVHDVEIDVDLATALKKQQDKITDEEPNTATYVPKMSVQTVKIDEDLQSALRKQQEKIYVEEERSEMVRQTEEQHIKEISVSNVESKHIEKVSGGAKAVKSLLSGEKPTDEDFDAAMRKRQSKLDSEEAETPKPIEPKSGSVVEYDDDLEVAMEKQQEKIDKMSEKDFTHIKSAATTTGIQLDTDLEVAMKKRQMKIDEMKEEEFRDVTTSAASTVKHDTDFEAAMKKRKLKTGDKIELEASCEVSSSEVSIMKAVTVQELTRNTECVQMQEEKTTKISLSQTNTDSYSYVEKTVCEVLDNNAQAVVLEIPTKNLDSRFQHEESAEIRDTNIKSSTELESKSEHKTIDSKMQKSSAEYVLEDTRTMLMTSEILEAEAELASKTNKETIDSANTNITASKDSAGGAAGLRIHLNIEAEATQIMAAEPAAANKAAGESCIAMKVAEEAAVAKKAAEDAVIAKKADEIEAARKAEEAATAKKAVEDSERVAEEAAVAKKEAEDDEVAKKVAADAVIAKKAAKDAEVVAEEVATAKKAVEDAEFAKKVADEIEAARKAEEAATAKKAVEDAERVAEEAAASKKAAEEAEATRKVAEEVAAAKKAAEEAEIAKKMADETAASKKADDEIEAARKVAEEAAAVKKAAEDAEVAKQVAEETAAAKKAAEEAEGARKVAEEVAAAMKAVEEAEIAKKVADEAAASKKAAEDVEVARKVAEEAAAAKKAAEDAEVAQRVAEEAAVAKKAAEEAEAARKVAEDAATTKKAAEVSKKVADEAAASKKAAEEAEAARKVAEEVAAAKKAVEEAEIVKKAADEVAASKKVADEVEAARKLAEAAEKAEAELKVAEEAAAARKAAEDAEAAKQVAEEAASAKKAAEDAKVARKVAEEAAAAKKAAEDAEVAQRVAEEAAVAKKAAEDADVAKKVADEAAASMKAADEVKAARKLAEAAEKAEAELKVAEEAAAAKKAAEDAEVAKQVAEEAAAAKKAGQDAEVAQRVTEGAAAAKKAAEDADVAKKVADEASASKKAAGHAETAKKVAEETREVEIARFELAKKALEEEEMRTATVAAASAAAVASSLGSEQVQVILVENEPSNSNTETNQALNTEINNSYKSTVEDNSRWDISPEQIEIVVHAARDLPKKGMFGKADPYVVISLGDQKIKSATVNNSYNPVWNLKTTLYVQPNAPREISIVVLDEDIGKDDLIGEMFLNVDDLVQVGELKDAWVPLGGCKSGEIQISSSILPARSSADEQGTENLMTLSSPAGKSKSPTPTILITSEPEPQVEISSDEDDYEIVSLDMVDGEASAVVLEPVKEETSSQFEEKVETQDGKQDVKHSMAVGSTEGTIDDPVISVAAQEVVKTVTAKAVEKVAAMTNNDREKKVLKTKQAAMEDPKMISTAMEVVEKATTDAVEKVAAMQARNPTVEIDSELIDELIEVKSLLKEERKTKIQMQIADLPIADVMSKNAAAHISPDVQAVSFGEATNIPSGATVASSQIKVTTVMKTLDEFGNVLTEDSKTTTVDEDNSSNQLFEGADIISSQQRVTTIKKTIDEFGNVIDEDIQTTMLGDDDETFKEIPSNVQVITSQKRVTNIKKTIDEFGNVISEDIQTTTTDDPTTENNTTKSTGQEFDRIVRKSYKNIIRTVDADGNVIEKVVEDSSSPDNWETSTVDMSSGIEMVTSESRETSIKKTIDEFGNVISEDIQTKRVEGGEDFDQFVRTSEGPLKKTSVKTVKKTVTVYAEEVAGHRDPSSDIEFPESETTTFSERLIRTVDSKGNVVEEVVKDDEIDWDPEEIHTVTHSKKKVTQTLHETLDKCDELEESSADATRKTSTIEIYHDKPRLDTIVFILHGATNLANKDMLGKSDPYAVISFGSQVSKTETINNDLNPTWQHQVTFQIDEKAPSHINIEFYDEDITKDECLGNTSIEVARIKVQRNISTEQQKLSNCRSGEIIFSAKYVTRLRIPQSLTSAGSQNYDEDDEDLLKRMDNLGLEKVTLRRNSSDDSTGSNESTGGLLKDVTHRQGNLRHKINTLKKTIRKSMTPQSWDGSSEMIHTTQFENETLPNQLFARTFELLDNEGNLIPLDGGRPWQSIKYFHTSSQPFQSIPSLRAHFVTAFEPAVPEDEMPLYEGESNSVQYEESLNTFIEQSSVQTTSTSSSAGAMFSLAGEHGSSGPQALELFLSGNRAELTPTGPVQGGGVRDWIEPLISSSCLTEKKFWKEDESEDESIVSRGHESHSVSSSEACQCSGSHTLRSPVSHLTHHTVQSLPASPHRKPSVKRTVVTSELFSSDEDKSRSLELIYSEPEDDQKRKLSSIYRSTSPAKDQGKFEKRKASFTQVKRVVTLDRQYSENELISGSSSPDQSKGSKSDNHFSPILTSSAMLPPSLPSVRGYERKVESGFEEQTPAPEFEEEEATKPDLQTDLTIPKGGRGVKVSSDKGIVREPSFIYDTSVETFGGDGASIDDLGCEKKTKQVELVVPADIIGRIATEIDLDPIDPFQAGADSLYLGGDFDFERHEGVAVNFGAFNNSSFTIPLSGEGHTTTMHIDVPDTGAHRLSGVSLEGGSKISSTPEGEKYFMAREDSFIEKVHKGELDNLAVEVSNYFSLVASNEQLVVKPITENPEAEIEISDLRPNSRLRVKPIDLSQPRPPVSSFETIYDKISLEEISSVGQNMTKEEILASLGDKFQGTVEVPDFCSSCDELCQLTGGASYLSPPDEDLDRRWTAPAGSVEAPILEAEEFTVRFQPVLERTEGHWGQLERMMGTESGRDQEADSSKKIPEQ